MVYTGKRYTDILDNRERQETRAENARMKHLARRGVVSETMTTHRNPMFEPTSLEHGMHPNPTFSSRGGGGSSSSDTLKEKLKANKKNAMRAHLESMSAVAPSTTLGTTLGTPLAMSPTQYLKSVVRHHVSKVPALLPDSLKARYLYYMGA